MGVRAVQTMDELELNDFRHGGVNITGFSLLDAASPRLQGFQREWSRLDPRFWHGAGRGRRLTVSHTARRLSSCLRP